MSDRRLRTGPSTFRGASWGLVVGAVMFLGVALPGSLATGTGVLPHAGGTGPSPGLASFGSSLGAIGPAPLSPPVHVCGNASLLGGPSQAPPGAVTIPAGNDSDMTASYELAPNTTYWLAPGTHTLGTGTYSQFQPDQGDTFVGAPGAVVDGQGVNAYAFTGNPNISPTNVTLEYLTIRNFTGGGEGSGVVNQQGVAYWTVEHDTIGPNEQNGSFPGGAGVMMASHNVVEWDCLTHNGEYGFSSFGGSTNITLSDDEISYNDYYGGYDHGGSSIQCGCSGGGKFWITTDVTIKDDWVHDNGNVGIWVDTDNSGLLIANNYIDDNYAEAIIYEISYNGAILNNTVLHNAVLDGPNITGFPDAAIYISESGFDVRAPDPFAYTDFPISGNLLTDNWGGVVLYENANRYCSDGSDQSCTLANPALYTLTSCAAHLGEQTPIDYYDNCRWHTQNVLVEENRFAFDPAGVSAACTAENFCGYNALFSIYGEAPYLNTAVPHNITFEQDNHFQNNTYLGPWNFDAWNQGNVVNWTIWRAPITDQCETNGDNQSGACDSGFHQDPGSTIGGYTGGPLALASASPSSGTAPLAVTFNGSALGGAPPFRWAWSFGDSSSASALENPEHTYGAPGTYAVELTVTDAQLNTGHAFLNVTVLPSVAALTATLSADPSSGVVGESFAVTSAIGGGSPPYTLAWSPSYAWCTPSERNLTCTPTTAGTYAFELGVRDGSGGATFAFLNVSVVAAPLPPLVATLAPPTETLTEGTPFELAAAATGGEAPYTFQWPVTYPWCVPSSATLTCTPTTAGTFEFEVEASDPAGQGAHAFANLTVAAAPTHPSAGSGSTLHLGLVDWASILAGGVIVVGIAVALVVRRRRRGSPPAPPDPEVPSLAAGPPP